MEGVKKTAITILHRFFLGLGVLAFLMILLAFTRLPFDWHYRLGTKTAAFTFTPDYIIMLGSGGMPDEKNLIRLYYTAIYAEQFPEAKIILTHPKDTMIVQAMQNELVLHEVDSNRISLETKGTNTREQALRLLEDFPGMTTKNILIVTSTENIYRTLQTFRKAGFEFVGGKPAFETAMHIDLSYNFKKAGGKKFVPDISDDISIRYNFWNYLKLEITCIREWFAIGYYKMNGWM